MALLTRNKTPSPSSQSTSVHKNRFSASAETLVAESGTIAGLEFHLGKYSNKRDDARLMQEVEKFVSRLYANSSFKKEVDAASQDGPIKIRFGRVPSTGVGIWSPGNRTVKVDPHHWQVNPFYRLRGDAGRLQGSVSFELINAASYARYEQIREDARNGKYEDETRDNNAPSVNGLPISPAERFARAIEHLEWENAKRHHQIMTEAKTAGMRIPRSADIFETPFGTAAKPGPFANFEDYFQHQVAAGHSDSYKVEYLLLRPSTPYTAWEPPQADEAGLFAENAMHPPGMTPQGDSSTVMFDPAAHGQGSAQDYYASFNEENRGLRAKLLDLIRPLKTDT